MPSESFEGGSDLMQESWKKNIMALFNHDFWPVVTIESPVVKAV